VGNNERESGSGLRILCGRDFVVFGVTIIFLLISGD
jgi:hypothetical protein